MCGITGFAGNALRVGDRTPASVVTAMSDALRHRGPDDGGIWADAQAGIALGHRRLSIIDLSPAGHQPMVSTCGRFVIAFNGEVYSHQEMRVDLEAAGKQFRGHSDTEVVLEAIAHWGIDRTLPRLIGMFAIALWDRESRELTLIRDRLGIKPVYWGLQDGLFLFGSELKALRAHPGWTPRLNRDAVATFLRHNYIVAPHSIYRGIHKLEPGHYLRYRAGGAPVVRRYWSFPEVAERGLAEPRAAPRDLLDQLEALLRDAVGRRMIADVPLGALLSGGVDSSLVTALMQAQSARPVRTFSIGFHEPGYNEAPYAKAIAEHLGTEHTELYVEPAHALAVIPRLTEWYDEPFSDSSQIPTYLVCELTRRHVAVVLSGDGGDELFTGYTRYLTGAAVWKRAGALPPALRVRLSRLLRGVSEPGWDRLFHLLPRRLRPAQAGLKVHKLAASLVRQDPDEMYRQMLSHWQEPDALVVNGREPKGVLWDPAVRARIPDFVDRMQYLDTLTYLPDDILTKVDRASMAVALEARVPLLDHRLVEFAWRIPQSMKVRDGAGKWALRQILYRHVPPPLIDRPKMGFGVPIDLWLRGPLRDWAETLLDAGRLRAQGLLDPAPIRARWAQHLAGENWAYPLWNVLVLQDWLDRYPGAEG